MTKTDTGGPAFPKPYEASDGMTLLDYFAAHSIIVAYDDAGRSPAEIAAYSYQIASAMLTERARIKADAE